MKPHVHEELHEDVATEFFDKMIKKNLQVLLSHFKGRSQLTDNRYNLRKIYVWLDLSQEILICFLHVVSKQFFKKV